MLHEGGWFFSTIADLQESTTFGAKAQKTAIGNLVNHGRIECECKGMPAKRYFRITNDMEILMKLIDEGTKFNLRSEEDIAMYGRELERLKSELSETEKSLEIAEKEKSAAASNYKTYLRQMQSDYDFVLEKVRREQEEIEQAERDLLRKPTIQRNNGYLGR